jgi:hypothetical protein
MPAQTPIDLGAPPRSTLPYPPIYKDAQFVALSDWDGTITMMDSNDCARPFLSCCSWRMPV